jgi:hypothetical protein
MPNSPAPATGLRRSKPFCEDAPSINGERKKRAGAKPAANQCELLPANSFNTKGQRDKGYGARGKGQGGKSSCAISTVIFCIVLTPEA